MNNYYFKKSNNWKKEDAGVIKQTLEHLNIMEEETHYIGVAVTGFTWSQYYAAETVGNLVDELFRQVAENDEVGSLYPRSNKSFMPNSDKSDDINKYVNDAFELHENYLKKKNIWLDLRFIDDDAKEIYMNRFVDIFSKSKFVECIFVAADEKFE